MPSYGSLRSPSLRKNMDNGHGYGSRNSFSVGRIIGDPFALATISIAIVSRGVVVAGLSKQLLTSQLSLVAGMVDRVH